MIHDAMLVLASILGAIVGSALAIHQTSRKHRARGQQNRLYGD